MMQSTFDFVWRFNLELTLLLAVILCIRWLLRNYANVAHTYWLWLALPLTPIAIELASMSTSLVEAIAVLKQSFSTTQAINSYNANDIPIAVAPPSTHLETTPEPAFQLPWLLLSMWAIGGGILLLRLCVQHFLLRKELSQISHQHALPINAGFPVVSVLKNDFSPSVYGFFKPKIYFPVQLFNDIGQQQSELIIQHEEQHIKQGHLWLNLAWDLLVCLCWFNPIIYLARSTFRHDQELLCDYLVLKHADSSRQRAYGHALLSTVSATHSVNLLCSWKMFDQLEERIMNIKSINRRNPAALIGAIAAALSLSTTYALATDDNAQQKEGLKTDSINIVKINTRNKKQTTITTDGKTFRLEDGKRFLIKDGEALELSDAEDKQFSELLAKHEEYESVPGKEKGRVFKKKHVHSYTIDNDDVVDFETIVETLGDLKPKEPPHFVSVDEVVLQSVTEGLKNLDSTDKELAEALKSLDETDNPILKDVRKELLKARKDIAKNKRSLEKQRTKAEKSLKKSKE